jgi:hypothetical protein
MLCLNLFGVYYAIVVLLYKYNYCEIKAENNFNITTLFATHLCYL